MLYRISDTIQMQSRIAFIIIYSFIYTEQNNYNIFLNFKIPVLNSKHITLFILVFSYVCIYHSCLVASN